MYPLLPLPATTPARSPEKHADSETGVPAYLRGGGPAGTHAPEERRDVPVTERVRSLLPAAVGVLKGLVGHHTFADWIVPILEPLADRAGLRSETGEETGAEEVSVGFGDGKRRFSLRLLVDDTRDPKLRGGFEAADGSARIVLYAQRLRDADADEVARVLYHEFIHLFRHWFSTGGISPRLPAVSPAMRSKFDARTAYSREIATLKPLVLVIAEEVRKRRLAASLPAFKGDVSGFAASLVEEAVVAAEVDFMMVIVGDVKARVTDVRGASLSNRTIVSGYLFESGLMFDESDRAVVTESPDAQRAFNRLHLVLDWVSEDYLMLRGGTEGAIRSGVDAP